MNSQGLFFYCDDDPYSHLMNAMVTRLEEDYDIKFELHNVNRPILPWLELSYKHKDYERTDIERLTHKYGIVPKRANNLPICTSNDLLERLGHYAPGTVYYNGVWYRGIDRIHYLQQRLGDSRDFYAPPILDTSYTDLAGEIDIFFSIKSPYSTVALQRLLKMSHHHDLKLNFKYVHPVIRYMVNPRDDFHKNWGTYALFDATREAKTHKCTINPHNNRQLDSERYYQIMAMLDFAIHKGVGEEFITSWVDAYFIRSVDLTDRDNIMQIGLNGGLSEQDIGRVVPNRYLPFSKERVDHQVKINVSELYGHRLWGIPAFRYKNTTTWGQDRLWVIFDQMTADMPLIA
jgi:2-hydroxychromene-2-carboxylate isomerase